MTNNISASLNHKIEKALDKYADPHEAADNICQKLSDEELLWAARQHVINLFNQGYYNNR